MSRAQAVRPAKQELFLLETFDTVPGRRLTFNKQPQTPLVHLGYAHMGPSGARTALLERQPREAGSQRRGGVGSHTLPQGQVLRLPNGFLVFPWWVPSGTFQD